MFRHILTFLALATLSCQSHETAGLSNISTNSPPQGTTNIAAEPNTPPAELIESFSNESKIGRPHKDKIEIYHYKASKGDTAVIKFFTRASSGQWAQKQTFEFEKDDLTNCDPKIEDFNNDGSKDFTYVSDVAARGANEKPVYL